MRLKKLFNLLRLPKEQQSNGKRPQFRFCKNNFIGIGINKL